MSPDKKKFFQSWSGIIAMVALTGFTVGLVFWGTVDTAVMLIRIFAAFTLTSILLDLLAYKTKPSPVEDKRGYHPNLQIWGVGALTGLGCAVFYWLGKLSTSLTANGAFSADTTSVGAPTWQYLSLVLIPFILLSLVVWGIVKICQPE
jgi:hypothetical protein